MSERYPDDVHLLAMEKDEATGVEYIPTGQSPYYLSFRKLVQRTLLAAQRANDLRVYQVGELTVGVRPGRCRIGVNVIDFAGQTGLTVAPSATTHVWLNDQGVVVQSVDGLPMDRRNVIPLAKVNSGATTIMQVVDLRGETMLGLPSLESMGLTASAHEVNQALAGASVSVTAAALGRVTGGPGVNADVDHRHQAFLYDEDGETGLVLANQSDDAQSNVALVFSRPWFMTDGLVLQPDANVHWLTQRYEGQTYHLVGVLSVGYAHQGQLTATVTDRLMGAVPIKGSVSAVVLSCATNMQSSVSGDGVTATVKVNGVTVTSTAAKISSAAGSGFRCTDRGHGTSAVVKTDGTQNVQRGDVLTVDLTRTVTGSVSEEMAQVAVLVVIRAGGPE